MIVTRDEEQQKTAQALIAESGEWMLKQVDERTDDTPVFDLVHRLRHSLRDMLRQVRDERSAT